MKIKKREKYFANFITKKKSYLQNAISFIFIKKLYRVIFFFQLRAFLIASLIK